MTRNEREVLEFLSSGWELGLRMDSWMLTKPASVMSIPGGDATIIALRSVSYIDASNCITASGCHALESDRSGDTF